MLLATGGAPVEVCTQAGNHGIGVAAVDFELDVPVELVEADLAADFGPDRPKEPDERPLELGTPDCYGATGGRFWSAASSCESGAVATYSSRYNP